MIQSNFKGKVAIHAKKQIAEQKASPRWLQNFIPFNPALHLTDPHKTLANQLFDQLYFNTEPKRILKLEQKRRDFEILLANLLYQQRRPVRISLNENDWGKTRYNKCSYYFVVEILKLLSYAKLIDMKTGYQTEEESRMTRIWATDELLEYFPEYHTAVYMQPLELVILRDKKGKNKEYKDTIETWRIRKILQRVNAVNGAALIEATHESKKYKLNAFLVAIFVEKFTWYGRLHTSGIRHYQGLSKDERKAITINNEPIVELDYSALHPTLLYASVGIQYEGDPYSVVDDRPQVRPFLKQILLCMLNAKDEITAEKAANNWLRENRKERTRLNEIGITRAKPIMDELFKAHEPISQYFYSGKDTGMRLMNKDAKIALDVVNHFAKQNKPILAIHDSFMVQQRYRDELLSVMHEVYEKHTGKTITIK